MKGVLISVAGTALIAVVAVWLAQRYGYLRGVSA